MKKTYHGSCHCKAVTFEADIDLSKGTGKCNCTVCWKTRNWSAQVGQDDFRLLTGEAVLSDMSKSGEWGEGHRRFCSVCGVITHSHGNIDAMGGPFLSVMIPALDDMTVDELVAAPVTYADGLHDNWWNPAPDTRHL